MRVSKINNCNLSCNNSGFKSKKQTPLESTTQLNGFRKKSTLEKVILISAGIMTVISALNYINNKIHNMLTNDVEMDFEEV